MTAQAQMDVTFLFFIISPTSLRLEVGVLLKSKSESRLTPLVNTLQFFQFMG
jgi:hypothetical protein